MGAGRKNKYETHIKPNLTLIADMCRNGATDQQIYENLGVGKDSFYRYKKEHIELSDILKRNKAIVDAEVENALLEEALKGNTTAQIFWLKNRRRDRWRDKHDIEHSGKVDSKVTYDNMTDEEILARAKELDIDVEDI